MLFRLLIITSLILGFVANCNGDDWQEIKSKIDASSIPNVAFILGNSSGNIYSYTKGNTSQYTKMMNVASASKWISSIVILKIAEQGQISLGTKPSQYFDWWTTSSSDPRSEVTLQMLLSFTSGAGEEASCVKGDDSKVLTIGNHMQVAGAMVEAATGKTWNQLFQQYIKTPLGLAQADAFYTPLSKPTIGGGLAISAQNYEKILRKIFLEDILPLPQMSQIQQDFTKDVTIAYSPVTNKDQGVWHYSLGNWIECPYKTWNESCYALKQYSSPGLFGFYPWVDRVNGYYAIIGTNDMPSATESIRLGYEIRPFILSSLSAKPEPPVTGVVPTGPTDDATNSESTRLGFSMFVVLLTFTMSFMY